MGGNKISKHTLSKSLVQCLAKFHAARGPVKIKDLFMPELSQVTNSVKLKHWGFIVKVSDPRNHWRITKKGEQFLFAEVFAPRVILTQDDQVVGEEGERIRVFQADGHFVRPEFHIYDSKTNDGQAVLF